MDVEAALHMPPTRQGASGCALAMLVTLFTSGLLSSCGERDRDKTMTAAADDPSDEVVEGGVAEEAPSTPSSTAGSAAPSTSSTSAPDRSMEPDGEPEASTEPETSAEASPDASTSGPSATTEPSALQDAGAPAVDVVSLADAAPQPMTDGASSQTDPGRPNQPAAAELINDCEVYCDLLDSRGCVSLSVCEQQCVEQTQTGLGVCDRGPARTLVRCWAEQVEEDPALTCDALAQFPPLLPTANCEDERAQCQSDNAPNPELASACEALCDREEEACELVGCDQRCTQQYLRESNTCGLDDIHAYFDCLTDQPLDTWECAQDRAISLAEQCHDIYVRSSCSPSAGLPSMQ